MTKTLAKGKYVTLLSTDDGYEYLHENHGDLVAVLGYMGTNVLGRFEVCPAHGDTEPTLCALTGHVEKDETPVKAAAREFVEESGIEVKAWELRRLGAVRPTKSTSVTAHLFAVQLNPQVVDVSRVHIGGGDGTDLEARAYCKFVRQDEALNAKDPILATMIARRMVK